MDACLQMLSYLSIVVHGAFRTQPALFMPTVSSNDAEFGLYQRVMLVLY